MGLIDKTTAVEILESLIVKRASLANADSFYSASHVAASGQELYNLKNLEASKATLGPTTGADLNDPNRLDTATSQFAYIPAGNDNHCYTDEVATPTGDFTVVAKVFADDLNASGSHGLAGQYTTSGNKRCWTAVLASGNPRVYVSSDGSATSQGTSAVDLTTVSGLADQEWFLIRFAFNFDAGGFTCPMDVSTDNGASWDSAGTCDIPAFTALQCYQTSTEILIGARYTTSATADNSFECWGGGIEYVSLDGNTTRVFDATDIDTTSDPDAGQTTWTTDSRTVGVGRDTSAPVTTVAARSTTVHDGVDDYTQLLAADTPTFDKTTGQFTVTTAMRNWVDGNEGRLWSSESANDNGAFIYLDGTTVTAAVGDGTTVVTQSATFTQGDLTAVSLIVNDGVLYLQVDATRTTGASLAGLGTITHATAPRIGCRADAVADNLAFEWFETVTHQDLAKSTVDVTAIGAALVTKVYP